VERAVAHGCEAFQIFTKNASQWRGRPLPPDEIGEFRSRVEDAGLRPVVSHASYLINLAAAGAELRRQSIAAMIDELDRAEALGLLGVVLHPGCDTAADGEAASLARVAEALAAVLAARPPAPTMVLLEHTAGQGRALGATFDELAAIIELADRHPLLGVCLDTCHLVASGYDILSPGGYARTFAHFERTVGFDRLKVLHLNDSKRPLGSRIDRHTHIGQGCLGLEPFRRLVNDPRFQGLPMLLETPKTTRRASGAVLVDPLDVANLRTLRDLIGTPAARPG
jgi:deoxyribonuclease-4